MQHAARTAGMQANSRREGSPSVPQLMPGLLWVGTQGLRAGAGCNLTGRTAATCALALSAAYVYTSYQQTDLGLLGGLLSSLQLCLQGSHASGSLVQPFEDTWQLVAGVAWVGQRHQQLFLTAVKHPLHLCTKISYHRAWLGRGGGGGGLASHQGGRDRPLPTMAVREVTPQDSIGLHRRSPKVLCEGLPSPKASLSVLHVQR